MIRLTLTNLYELGDHYNPENSYIPPALIRRFHQAMKAGVKSVICWRTGSPIRGFCMWMI